MVEERKHAEDSDEADHGHEEETREDRTRGERLSDAISSLRQSLEETIDAARERGDVAEEKARELLRTATERARTATADARERFDFVTHDEFRELAARVGDLESKLEGRLDGADPATREDSGPD